MVARPVGAEVVSDAGEVDKAWKKRTVMVGHWPSREKGSDSDPSEDLPGIDFLDGMGTTRSLDS